MCVPATFLCSLLGLAGRRALAIACTACGGSLLAMPRIVATACAVVRGLTPASPALACALQVVVVLTIAKMSSMHRVRIFGINKD